MSEQPAVLLELARLADQQIDRLIGAAKARGCSWAQLGMAMGITGDGVRMRMRRRQAVTSDSVESARNLSYDTGQSGRFAPGRDTA